MKIRNKLNNNVRVYIFATILAILIILVFLYISSFSTRDAFKTSIQSIEFNQYFIEDLYKPFNISDSISVFDKVFQQLDDDVVVYPTENYYYFKFAQQGYTIGGTLSLPANSRDNGTISFGYAVRNEDPSFIIPTLFAKGGGQSLNESDGVFVKKIDNFLYRVTYKHKAVYFHLNDLNQTKPEALFLLPFEEFVGQSFDESGMKFFLIYNKQNPHFYWILNDLSYVSDSLKAPLENYSNLLLGERTQFLFYSDVIGRKVLVGAKGTNVLQNNWYDGPFDQLPDNYIYNHQIDIQSKIEAAYPQTQGRISYQGYYLDEPSTRVAIGTYTVYFSNSDVAEILACEIYAPLSSDFYNCLTTQRYDVPEGYF